MRVPLLWLVLVGAIWGSTNPFIKRGSSLKNKAQKDSKTRRQRSSSPTLRNAAATVLYHWAAWLSNWQYVVPFLINLSGSVLYFMTLSDADISVAVPVANGTTFAFTAVVGWLLGEKCHPLFTSLGLGFMLLGIHLCVSS